MRIMRIAPVVATLVVSATVLLCAEPALGQRPRPIPRVRAPAPVPGAPLNPLLEALARLEDLEGQVSALQTALIAEIAARHNVETTLQVALQALQTQHDDDTAALQVQHDDDTSALQAQHETGLAAETDARILGDTNTLADAIAHADSLAFDASILRADLDAETTAREFADMMFADVLMHFSRVGNDLYITGANLHIVNGLDRTTTTNGLGNLIIGYNELRDERFPLPDVRTGSHMLVVGEGNNFSGFGGIVMGLFNDVSGVFSSVTGGSGNVASGTSSSVSGGTNNTASALEASVSGGKQNIASGIASSVMGGANNWEDVRFRVRFGRGLNLLV